MITNSGEHDRNEKSRQTVASRGFQRLLSFSKKPEKCPGLKYFHTGVQYLISSVCHICVISSYTSQNRTFNVRFFSFVLSLNES